MDLLETQVPLVLLAIKASTDIMDSQARKDLQATLAGQATMGNPGKLVNAETQAVRARTPNIALAHVKRTEIKLLHKPMIEIYVFSRFAFPSFVDVIFPVSLCFNAQVSLLLLLLRNLISGYCNFNHWIFCISLQF